MGDNQGQTCTQTQTFYGFIYLQRTVCYTHLGIRLNLTLDIFIYGDFKGTLDASNNHLHEAKYFSKLELLNKWLKITSYFPYILPGQQEFVNLNNHVNLHNIHV